MLITVGRYLDPWEAHILRGRLEAEGIPATIAGDQHVLAKWPLSVALGGVAIQVPSGFLEATRDVLAAYKAGVFERDLITEDPSALDLCPSCGGHKIQGSIPLEHRILVIFTYLLASAPFPTGASLLQCQICGHRWNYWG